MRALGLMAVIAALAAGAVQAQPASEDAAQAYNLNGMEFYHQRRYDEAEACFRNALKEDPSHKLANYNLACILSLKLTRDHWLWRFEDGDGDDPFAQLERAISVDPDAARKAALDPDFLNIRLTPRFQALIGADLGNPDLIKAILVAQAEWFGIPCGAWCGNDLLFFETGRVFKRIYTQERGPHELKYEAGEYSVEAGTITIRFPSGEVLRGRFDEAGDLQTGDNWRSRYLVRPAGDI